MKRFYFEDENGIETLYIGTAREIKSLYKNLAIKTSAIPLHSDCPILKKGSMYGIYVSLDGFYVVYNANVCLALLAC